ncbi:unnamed protein product, partial [Owenia fusiformis]
NHSSNCGVDCTEDHIKEGNHSSHGKDDCTEDHIREGNHSPNCKYDCTEDHIREGNHSSNSKVDCTEDHVREGNHSSNCKVDCTADDIRDGNHSSRGEVDCTADHIRERNHSSNCAVDCTEDHIREGNHSSNCAVDCSEYHIREENHSSNSAVDCSEYHTREENHSSNCPDDCTEDHIREGNHSSNCAFDCSEYHTREENHSSTCPIHYIEDHTGGGNHAPFIPVTGTEHHIRGKNHPQNCPIDCSQSHIRDENHSPNYPVDCTEDHISSGIHSSNCLVGCTQHIRCENHSSKWNVECIENTTCCNNETENHIVPVECDEHCSTSSSTSSDKKSASDDIECREDKDDTVFDQFLDLWSSDSESTLSLGGIQGEDSSKTASDGSKSSNTTKDKEVSLTKNPQQSVPEYTKCSDDEDDSLIDKFIGIFSSDSDSTSTNTPIESSSKIPSDENATSNTTVSYKEESLSENCPESHPKSKSENTTSCDDEDDSVIDKVMGFWSSDSDSTSTNTPMESSSKMASDENETTNTTVNETKETLRENSPESHPKSKSENNASCDDEDDSFIDKFIDIFSSDSNSTSTNTPMESTNKMASDENETTNTTVNKTNVSLSESCPESHPKLKSQNATSCDDEDDSVIDKFIRIFSSDSDSTSTNTPIESSSKIPSDENATSNTTVSYKEESLSESCIESHPKSKSENTTSCDDEDDSVIDKVMGIWSSDSDSTSTDIPMESSSKTASDENETTNTTVNKTNDSLNKSCPDSHPKLKSQNATICDDEDDSVIDKFIDIFSSDSDSTSANSPIESTNKIASNENETTNTTVNKTKESLSDKCLTTDPKSEPENSTCDDEEGDSVINAFIGLWSSDSETTSSTTPMETSNKTTSDGKTTTNSAVKSIKQSFKDECLTTESKSEPENTTCCDDEGDSVIDAFIGLWSSDSEKSSSNKPIASSNKTTSDGNTTSNTPVNNLKQSLSDECLTTESKSEPENTTCCDEEGDSVIDAFIGLWSSDSEMASSKTPIESSNKTTSDGNTSSNTPVNNTKESSNDECLTTESKSEPENTTCCDEEGDSVIDAFIGLWSSDSEMASSKTPIESSNKTTSDGNTSSNTPVNNTKESLSDKCLTTDPKSEPENSTCDDEEGDSVIDAFIGLWSSDSDITSSNTPIESSNKTTNDGHPTQNTEEENTNESLNNCPKTPDSKSESENTTCSDEEGDSVIDAFIGLWSSDSEMASSKTPIESSNKTTSDGNTSSNTPVNNTKESSNDECLTTESKSEPENTTCCDEEGNSVIEAFIGLWSSDSEMASSKTPIESSNKTTSDGNTSSNTPVNNTKESSNDECLTTESKSEPENTTCCDEEGDSVIDAFIGLWSSDSEMASSKTPIESSNKTTSDGNTSSNTPVNNLKQSLSDECLTTESKSEPKNTTCCDEEGDSVIDAFIGLWSSDSQMASSKTPIESSNKTTSDGNTSSNTPVNNTKESSNDECLTTESKSESENTTCCDEEGDSVIDAFIGLWSSDSETSSSNTPIESSNKTTNDGHPTQNTEEENTDESLNDNCPTNPNSKSESENTTCSDEEGDSVIDAFIGLWSSDSETSSSNKPIESSNKTTSDGNATSNTPVNNTKESLSDKCPTTPGSKSEHGNTTCCDEERDSVIDAFIGLWSSDSETSSSNTPIESSNKTTNEGHPTQNTEEENTDESLNDNCQSTPDSKSEHGNTTCSDEEGDSVINAFLGLWSSDSETTLTNTPIESSNKTTSDGNATSNTPVNNLKQSLSDECLTTESKSEPENTTCCDEEGDSVIDSFIGLWSSDSEMASSKTPIESSNKTTSDGNTSSNTPVNNTKESSNDECLTTESKSEPENTTCCDEESDSVIDAFIGLWSSDSEMASSKTPIESSNKTTSDGNTSSNTPVNNLKQSLSDECLTTESKSEPENTTCCDEEGDSVIDAFIGLWSSDSEMASSKTPIESSNKTTSDGNTSSNTPVNNTKESSNDECLTTESKSEPENTTCCDEEGDSVIDAFIGLWSSDSETSSSNTPIESSNKTTNDGHPTQNTEEENTDESLNDNCPTTPDSKSESENTTCCDEEGDSVIDAFVGLWSSDSETTLTNTAIESSNKTTSDGNTTSNTPVNNLKQSLSDECLTTESKSEPENTTCCDEERISVIDAFIGLWSSDSETTSTNTPIESSNKIASNENETTNTTVNKTKESLSDKCLTTDPKSEPENSTCDDEEGDSVIDAFIGLWSSDSETTSTNTPIESSNKIASNENETTNTTVNKTKESLSDKCLTTDPKSEPKNSTCDDEEGDSVIDAFIGLWSSDSDITSSNTPIESSNKTTNDGHPTQNMEEENTDESLNDNCPSSPDSKSKHENTTFCDEEGDSVIDSFIGLWSSDSEITSSNTPIKSSNKTTNDGHPTQNTELKEENTDESLNDNCQSTPDSKSEHENTTCCDEESDSVIDSFIGLWSSDSEITSSNTPIESSNKTTNDGHPTQNTEEENTDESLNDNCQSTPDSKSEHENTTCCEEEGDSVIDASIGLWSSDSETSLSNTQSSNKATSDGNTSSNTQVNNTKESSNDECLTTESKSEPENTTCCDEEGDSVIDAFIGLWSSDCETTSSTTPIEGSNKTTNDGHQTQNTNEENTDESLNDNCQSTPDSKSESENTTCCGEEGDSVIDAFIGLWSSDCETTSSTTPIEGSNKTTNDGHQTQNTNEENTDESLNDNCQSTPDSKSESENTTCCDEEGDSVIDAFIGLVSSDSEITSSNTPIESSNKTTNDGHPTQNTEEENTDESLNDNCQSTPDSKSESENTTCCDEEGDSVIDAFIGLWSSDSETTSSTTPIEGSNKTTNDGNISSNTPMNNPKHSLNDECLTTPDPKSEPENTTCCDEEGDSVIDAFIGLWSSDFETTSSTTPIESSNKTTNDGHPTQNTEEENTDESLNDNCPTNPNSKSESENTTCSDVEGDSVIDAFLGLWSSDSEMSSSNTPIESSNKTTNDGHPTQNTEEENTEESLNDNCPSTTDSKSVLENTTCCDEEGDSVIDAFIGLLSSDSETTSTNTPIESSNKTSDGCPTPKTEVKTTNDSMNDKCLTTDSKSENTTCCDEEDDTVIDRLIELWSSDSEMASSDTPIESSNNTLNYESSTAKTEVENTEQPPDCKTDANNSDKEDAKSDNLWDSFWN